MKDTISQAATLASSFHSTDFPYERGHVTTIAPPIANSGPVSIQLISPTRGD